MTILQLGRGNFNDLLPAAPAGRVNVKFQLDDSLDPGNVSGHVANYGGVNVQAGTSYTLLASDQGKLVVFTNAAAVAVTLDSTLPNTFTCGVLFLGAAGGTITPSTGTVNGAANLPFTTGGGALVYFNGTNWWALEGAATGGGSGGGFNGVSVKTANYNLASGDNGKLIVANSASAISFTLPNPPPSATWAVLIANINTGTLTVARNSLNIDGAANNLTLLQSQGLAILTDNSNYFTDGDDPLWAASQTGVQNESYTYAADSGAANAYAVTLSPVPSAYVAGMGVVFKAANSNTGASTLNVNSLGATSIKKWGGSTALVANDIAAGQIIHAVYDGTNFQMLVPVSSNNSGGGDTTAEYLIGAVDSSLPNAAVIPGFYGSADVQPASAGSFDDEFPGSSLSGSWTWVNQGSGTTLASATVAKSFLTLKSGFVPTGPGTNWQYIYQVAPGSTPWEVTLQFSYMAFYATNFLGAGLILSDSSGKIIVFGASAGNTLTINYYNSPTSFNSQQAGQINWAAYKWYMRIRDDGTNLLFSFSIQGQGWLQYLSLSRTAFLTSGPTRLGIGVDSENTHPVIVESDWIRRTL